MPTLEAKQDTKQVDMRAAKTAAKPATKPATRPRRMSNKRRDWILVAIGRLAVLAAILGIWEAIITFKLVNPVLASSPTAVGRYLIDSFRNGEMMDNLVPSYLQHQ